MLRAKRGMLAMSAVALITACAVGGAGVTSSSAAFADDASESGAEETQTLTSPDIGMDQWKDLFPNEYDSYLLSSYAEYPVEGTGMAGSLWDVTHVANFSAGCLTCHSTQMSSLLDEYGSDLLTIKSVAEGRYGHTGMSDEEIEAAKEATPESALTPDDVRIVATQGITCYQCHGDTPGQMVVANEWTREAADEAGIDADNPDLVCAQCHSVPDYTNILTNPDSSTWFMLGAGTDPDDVYQAFLDRGVKNPIFSDEGLEFDNFYGSTMDMAGADCVDCHTQKLTDENGNTYTNHAFLDPGTHTELYENCSTCHEDSAQDRQAAVQQVQADFQQRADDAKVQVDALGEAIEQARSENVSDDVLNEVTDLYDRALFYYNYGRDTSGGVHQIGNDTTSTCFEKAEAAVQEGMGLLE